MNNLNNFNKKEKEQFIDGYLKCISYCDILPKGIDPECEFICNIEYKNIDDSISKRI